MEKIDPIRQSTLESADIRLPSNGNVGTFDSVPSQMKSWQNMSVKNPEKDRVGIPPKEKKMKTMAILSPADDIKIEYFEN